MAPPRERPKSILYGDARKLRDWRGDSRLLLRERNGLAAPYWASAPRHGCVAAQDARFIVSPWVSGENIIKELLFSRWRRKHRRKPLSDCKPLPGYGRLVALQQQMKHDFRRREIRRIHWSTSFARMTRRSGRQIGDSTAPRQTDGDQ